ncbi:hypothetical protein ASG29_02875 [Sphingomonas sp. Leaf412]|uniref:DUF2141 domain-containing protein n=1 Tax=Sphingomonas sp. Leaf412 TaxID=1736370 RepID=UPI0006FE9D5A|nr:DUF2141 domain-containing protein [Sphingomonas sp. Leaf412]KQT35086.1 hypothetical protein ASG29_02875 [Sphingomonas sp. Leaf412]
MPVRAAALAAVAWTLLGASPSSDLDIELSNLRSAKGLVRLCLTADPDNFPNCTDDRNALTRSLPAGTRSVRLASLSPGGYAVAVIHDENANAKLDTFAGIPKEGFGFSRNPPVRFGAPRFAAARFRLDGGAQTQQVRMRYIL